MRATSSVSSLEEGEGILNDDEYERAVCRVEKINKKITTLIKNWNEESKIARSSAGVIEVDKFYRPYLDQYNTRRKALECLMEIYLRYFKDETPSKMRDPSSTVDQIDSQITNPKEKAPVIKTEKKILFG